jgi:hypothetical protein
VTGRVMDCRAKLSLHSSHYMQYVRPVLIQVAQASDVEGENTAMWTELRVASRACVLCDVVNSASQVDFNTRLIHCKFSDRNPASFLGCFRFDSGQGDWLS